MHPGPQSQQRVSNQATLSGKQVELTRRCWELGDYGAPVKGVIFSGRRGGCCCPLRGSLCLQPRPQIQAPHTAHCTLHPAPRTPHVADKGPGRSHSKRAGRQEPAHNECRSRSRRVCGTQETPAGSMEAERTASRRRPQGSPAFVQTQFAEIYFEFV